MADSDDLELGSEDDPAGTAHATHPVRKRIAIKLRHGGKGRGSGGTSGRKAKTKSSKDSASERDQAGHNNDDETHFGDDVDKTMQFASVKIGGSLGEPFHKNQKLKWDHKVNLLGEKIVDPLIHSCEKCSLPILIYGRMIPCKHVFCYSCAKTTDKNCPRCSQSVVRIEQAALGTVFVCTFGGTKHGVSGCHRTYLSQRDLQAHVAHRHFGAGREAAAPRVVPAEMLSAPGAARPTGAGPVLAYSVTQPMPTMISDGSNLVFRPHQPTAPSGPAMPPIVVSRPPPGIPQQQLPPPQHILTQHGPRVIGTNPPNLPPRILPTSHASGMPPPPSISPMANPPAMLVQTVPVGAPPSAVRPTNLITIKMPDEGEYHHSVETSSSAGRPPFASQQPPTHENPLTHFTAQHFPPHGPPPVSFKQTQEHHHQMSVRPLMTHPGAPPAPSSQLSRPTGMVGMPPGQMGPLSAPPQRLGPSPQSIPSGPPQNMAPPPQAIHSGPPQGMHAGPPGMHTGPPPQGLHAAPPPQGIHPGPPPSMHPGPPPQALHAGPPPPQGLRSAPPPGFPPPARHPPDQHVQLQQMSWPGAGPAGGQVQRIAAPPGSRPSPAASQSMPFYHEQR